MPFTYKQLTHTDSLLFKELMKIFAEAFNDQEQYQSAIPNESYIEQFLSDTSHIVIVSMNEAGNVVGGLVAYELQKFEQARKEIYVYDVATATAYQRQGIGTELFIILKKISQERGAYVIFVQADKEDLGAVSFYRKISSSEVEGYVFDMSMNEL